MTAETAPAAYVSVDAIDAALAAATPYRPEGLGDFRSPCQICPWP